EGALVAVAAHRGDPARVDHPRPEHPGGLLGQGAGSDGIRRRRVPHVGFRVGTGERPHGGDHAAVVDEVVVGVGDVVFAGVDVLGRHLDPAVVGAHVLRGRTAVQATPVGESAPGGVDLGQILVV